MDYFFVELRLEAHFEALRHFLLMEDGEFAQSLSDLLFEKVTPGVEGCGTPGAGGRDTLKTLYPLPFSSGRGRRPESCSARWC